MKLDTFYIITISSVIPFSINKSCLLALSGQDKTELLHTK